MNCTEAQKLINPYIDGELDLVNSLAVEQHLHDCAGCARIYQNRTALRAGVRSGLWMSIFLAAAGLSAGAIHTAFLLSDRAEFRTPVSIAVITATTLLSLVQLWAAARALRRRAEGGPDASSETPSFPAL